MENNNGVFFSYRTDHTKNVDEFSSRSATPKSSPRVRSVFDGQIKFTILDVNYYFMMWFDFYDRVPATSEINAPVPDFVKCTCANRFQDPLWFYTFLHRFMHTGRGSPWIICRLFVLSVISSSFVSFNIRSRRSHIFHGFHLSFTSASG